jgi:hypothetical protein
MQNQLNNAVRIIEVQVNRVVECDNKLNEIYGTFFKETSFEKKNQMLDTYLELLNGRNDLLKPLTEVQDFLMQIIEDLDKNHLDWFERYNQKRKIKKMELNILKYKPLQEKSNLVTNEKKIEVTPIAAVKAMVEEIKSEKKEMSNTESKEKDGKK